jgi:hypothetical protein
MPIATTDRPLAAGDKVKLKDVQESAYRPQSLLNYLADNGLSEDTAVFTVSDIFDGPKDTMVDFAELDTRGGYYLRRFELAPTDGPDVVAYSQAAVDRLVAQARADARAEALAEAQAHLGTLVA